MTRGPLIIIGVSLMVAGAIVVYIGIHSLPRVLSGFWQLIVLGAAIATFVLMLIWDRLVQRQVRWHAELLQSDLQVDREAVDEQRRRNMALLEQVTERAQRAEQSEQAALMHRAEADAKVENMEYKLRNGLAMVRRIKTRNEKRKGQGTGKTELKGARPLSREGSGSPSTQ